MKRRPFTCPSPWTPSAKYPPGGPSAIPLLCARRGPRAAPAAFRHAVRSMPIMTSRRRRACVRARRSAVAATLDEVVLNSTGPVFQSGARGGW